MDICEGGRTQIQWTAGVQREQLQLKGKDKQSEVEVNVRTQILGRSLWLEANEKQIQKQSTKSVR